MGLIAGWTGAAIADRRDGMSAAPFRQAIVDIGSNSIRLVVYGGPRNAPVPLYDDKITASLGRGVVLDGRIDAESMALALKARASRLERDIN